MKKVGISLDKKYVLYFDLPTRFIFTYQQGLFLLANRIHFEPFVFLGKTVGILLGSPGFT